MLSKKPLYTLYTLLLIILSVVGSTAIANSNVSILFSEVAAAFEEAVAKTSETVGKNINFTNTDTNTENKSTAALAPMFTTIIQGADEEVGCSVQGFTVARFNLCGDFDDRIISLSGGPYGSVSWQLLGGACTPDINEDCPNTSSCYTQVATGQTFALDASGVSSTVGAEYKVIADGQTFYFKVKKRSITQTYVKSDFICGVPGRIQITNLSSAYEYSIDSGSGFGPWQGAIFSNLTPGTYNVKARLQNTANTCEYPYEPITIDQEDIEIETTFVDAQCSGETGSITVTANNVPGPYKYTLLNSSGVAQEFTAFIATNPYTFSAVGFGTYSIQVETQQCQGDPLNGIDPPRQNVDTSGNPITIGAGLNALDASTEVNSSFGCSDITSVDISLNVIGGSSPYRFTVNSGPLQPSFGNTSTNSGTTTYTVTSADTYDFIITDSNGCTISASSNVEMLLPPDVTAAGVDGTCSNGGARVDFTINDPRGYNLSYRINTGDPWVTTPQISVPAGTYNDIEVRYQQGSFECTIILPSITVTNIGAISGSATKISDITCDGSGGTNGGQIDFVGPFSGGSGSGYVFSIDGVNFTGITSYTNLAAGTYTPIIRDGGGCRLELTAIEILDTDPPTDIDFVQSNVDCTSGTSDVTLNPTIGGAAIARYEVLSPTPGFDADGDNTNNIITGLSTSTSYIFQITDTNGCTYTEGFSPAVISSIRARVKSGGDLRICNGASDGTGTFIIDGFANNYTYDINGGLYTGGPQNDAEVDLPFSGAGTYTITVTDADTGCTDTASFNIQEATVLDLSSSTVTPMSCANGNVGRIIASAVGGWGAYRYTLTPPTGSVVGPKSGATFSNLSAPGNYSLLVEDAEGCTDTFTFNLAEIDAPTISLDAAASDFCYIPGVGATIVVNSTSGSAALATHQYRINGGTLQASGTFSNLSPGNYTIEVVDANNCSATINQTINQQLRVNTSLETEIPCGVSPGQIRVQVTGGYTSGPGSKQYRASSDNGSTFSPWAPLTSNNFLYDITVGGTYVFEVEDNNDSSAPCAATSSPLVVEPPVNITPADIAIFPASCGNTDNGRVVITPDATSGIPPYEIAFVPTGTLTIDPITFRVTGPYSDQTVYSNLTAGDTYDYIVRDDRGCDTGIFSITIPLDNTPTPEAIVSDLPATCSAGNEVAGGIRIDNVIDGNENFTFIVEDSFGNQLDRVDNVPRATLPYDFTGDAFVPGTYTVITLDQNGCRDIDTVTITTTEVVITPINFTPAIDCDDSGFTYTVEVTPTIFPTTPTYQIRIAGQPAFYPLNNNAGNDTHEFSNATDGIEYGVAYTVEVLAPNGCIYEEEIPPIDGFSDLDISATSGSAFCDNSGNGRTDFTVMDFVGPSLVIDILDENNIVLDTDSPSGLTGGTGSSYPGSFDVQPGAYTIRVTDSNGCTDATTINVILDSPRVDVISNIPANCNALGQITFVGSGGTPFATGSPYLYAVVPQNDSVSYVSPTDTSDDFTDETTIVLPGSVAGITYDIWVIDSRGCTFMVSQEIVQLQPDLPEPIITVVNQCDVTATSFDISVTISASVNTPRFTMGGALPTNYDATTNPTPNPATFVVATPGSFTIDVVDANGCTGSGIAEVYEFLSVSGGFTTYPTCLSPDGVITVEPLGGSNDFSYQLQDEFGANIGASITGDRTDGIFNGIGVGNYIVEVTDNETNCVDTVTVSLDSVTPPVIDSASSQNISCVGENDGSIDVILAVGTDVDTPIDYRLLDFDTRALITNNALGSFTDLPAGRYEVEVISASNCSDLSGLLEIVEPADFSIGIDPVADFTCEAGGNRFSSTEIIVNIVNPGTIGLGYQYSITGFSDYQSSNTFEIVDNGSPQNITVYAIDGNGCQTTFNVPTINPPTDVVPSIIEIDPLNCRDDERVRIEVSGTTDFTISTISVTPIAPVTNVSGISFADVFLPDSGDYIFEITDNIGGCIYPLPIHTVNEPILPVAFISEAKPVSCFGASDGELFIEVTDYTGVYDYRVFESTDITKTNVLQSGTFDTNNFPDVSGNEARITGLPGGNLYVEVVANEMPFCSNDSNVGNIRTPNGSLLVDAVSVGNVGCNNNLGVIEATGQGGWDTSPYEYRLLLSTDGGATYTTEIAPYSPNNEFTSRGFGFYQVQIRDVELCTNTFNIELEEVPRIDAGIREPQGLDCPNGNNAVLEAFDPTTGDAITATPGATGGFPGAGYNYRLLYLNSNDKTNIGSASGLQDSPTFIGSSGGFISAGWYAIEVSSSFDCIFVTEPYFVDPPPPVLPLLVQTRVPGCGGIGEMRLTIENPDPLFTYEYAPVENGTVVGPYQTMAGTSVLILGVQGVTYQFDVRKTSTLSICLPVRSNGITMTDATGITILPNLPDDISCASELDGRIESFVNGGVGDDLFYLYNGDPVDAFNPAATATLFRGPQPDGTFEGLPEATDYYIAVTSGDTCMDIAGPFAIVRPDPIVFDANPTPVTCNNDGDGTITVEVLSGGIGLIQFAISPNFNEFFSDPLTPGVYVFDELEGGTYEILIQDENGCFEKDFITVTEPDEVEIINIRTTPELCIGANDGTVVFDVIGGTPFNDPLVSASPYFEYKIEMIDPIDETGTAVFAPYDGQIIQNLQGGASYAIYVQDANLCPSSELFTIEIGVDLTAEPIVEYGCEGIFPNSTVTVEMQESNLLSQILFALDPIDPTDAISSLAGTERSWGDLPAGDHIVYIYHENGCTNFVEFVVDSYDPLTLNAMKTGPNELVANAEGGYGGYEYFFNGESYEDENTYTTNESEMVNIRVVDSNGCIAQVNIPFEFTGMLEIPNFFTPDGDNQNDVWSPRNREFFPDIEVKIYDRYGRVVAILNEITSWDGTYEGNEVPTGDYWYVVNANDKTKQRYVGHFTLYR